MQAGQEMDQTFFRTKKKVAESTSKDKQYYDVLSIYSMQERSDDYEKMAHYVLDPVLCFLKKRKACQN